MCVCVGGGNIQCTPLAPSRTSPSWKAMLPEMLLCSPYPPPSPSPSSSAKGKVFLLPASPQSRASPAASHTTRLTRGEAHTLLRQILLDNRLPPWNGCELEREGVYPFVTLVPSLPVKAPGFNIKRKKEKKIMDFGGSTSHLKGDGEARSKPSRS